MTKKETGKYIFHNTFRPEVNILSNEAKKYHYMIGNKVWIGTNSVIVGKITIGDNVLIAPNSFVNFDVPSNSIVIGNPGKIIPSTNATDKYINNEIKNI